MRPPTDEEEERMKPFVDHLSHVLGLAIARSVAHDTDVEQATKIIEQEGFSPAWMTNIRIQLVKKDTDEKSSSVETTPSTEPSHPKVGSETTKPFRQKTHIKVGDIN